MGAENRKDTDGFLSDYIVSEFVVRKEHEGMRADAFLALKADFLSRTRIKQKIQNGESLLNGKPHSASKRLKRGDVLTVRWRSTDDRVPAPVPDVVYEDECFIAVNKPAGVPVHPTGRKQSGTLLQGVYARMREEIHAELLRGAGEFYPRLLNRLDLFTSGVVLVAKTKKAFVEVQKLQVRRKVHKRYVVLVEGRVDPPKGEITFPLGPDEESGIFIKQCVRDDGLPSCTRYEVIRYAGSCTLLHAWPVTGRQHQIRVHFAALGHPVWGDLIYKDEALFFRYYENDCSTEGLPPRHALHAEVLEFVHPFSGRRLSITAPLTPDMEEIIRTVEEEGEGT